MKCLCNNHFQIQKHDNYRKGRKFGFAKFRLKNSDCKKFRKINDARKFGAQKFGHFQFVRTVTSLPGYGCNT